MEIVSDPKVLEAHLDLLKFAMQLGLPLFQRLWGDQQSDNSRLPKRRTRIRFPSPALLWNRRNPSNCKGFGLSRSVLQTPPVCCVKRPQPLKRDVFSTGPPIYRPRIAHRQGYRNPTLKGEVHVIEVRLSALLLVISEVSFERKLSHWPMMAGVPTNWWLIQLAGAFRSADVSRMQPPPRWRGLHYSLVPVF